MAARIIERIAAVPHVTYVEPFIGMGGVFFRRPFRARAEVINDVSRDVANLFRVLQRHYVPLMDMLRWQVTSRAEFERLHKAQPDTLTDLERAVRFLYLQRTAFGGKVTGRAFGVSPGTAARFDVAKLTVILEGVHERLSGRGDRGPALCRPGAALPTARARCSTSIPVLGRRGGLRDRRVRPRRLRAIASLLGSIQGRFILSLNDRPEVREMFAAFETEPVSLFYGINKDGQVPAAELLISGP